ncbi:MAG: 1-acyl-sn-glycerol-3-phosphate acyltransferase [Anaerolineales bacterium]|jgi:1-acyl-sn-glycerol-3-phosphate acyltransferase|nr:1-acyl-sn-glycerol-3-phosphate acyltransferase [Anaerolineales bacterium]MBP6209336.1 1-acyl-sn-glycerol-3-phosphate acyltransferase [Anaerolineales bacterium]MBP8164134.1 1-acyl-sn-glycerol-3-phosphate acyltransferase [Anaerolineales bacterium]
MKPYHVPFRIKLNRLIIRPTFRLLYRTLGRVKITGLENVPLGKPYVIAMNHISIFDPPLVVSFWAETPEVIGAADVFKKKGQGLILSLYGVIPVHRGDYDRALLDKVIAILKQGRPLVIAPEGGRSHVPAMQRAMPGVGYIIEHAQVPVVPVGLVGTTDDFWQKAKQGMKPQLEMRIGKPIVFPPISEKGAARREARQVNADHVMRVIAGLLPDEYHGVYAGQAIHPA